MKQNELKNNVVIMIVVAVVAAILRVLRFIEIVSVDRVITSLFFGVFVGALVVVLKNGYVFLKNNEQRRGESGRMLIIFSIIAVFCLVLTCILATIFN